MKTVLLIFCVMFFYSVTTFCVVIGDSCNVKLIDADDFCVDESLENIYLLKNNTLAQVSIESGTMKQFITVPITHFYKYSNLYFTDSLIVYLLYSYNLSEYSCRFTLFIFDEYLNMQNKLDFEYSTDLMYAEFPYFYFTANRNPAFVDPFNKLYYELCHDSLIINKMIFDFSRKQLVNYKIIADTLYTLRNGNIENSFPHDQSFDLLYFIVDDKMMAIENRGQELNFSSKFMYYRDSCALNIISYKSIPR